MRAERDIYVGVFDILERINEMDSRLQLNTAAMQFDPVSFLAVQAAVRRATFHMAV